MEKDASRRRQVESEFDRSPVAPRQARQLLSRVLDVWNLDDEDEVAALLTSEAVTNAVRYAASRVEVRLTEMRDALRVEIRDAERASPRLQRVGPLSVDAESGRGLFLVAALARAWGMEPEGEGKVVWFEVPVKPRTTGAGTGAASESSPPPLRRPRSAPGSSPEPPLG